jgi:uncharacterized protein YqeY
MLYQLQEELKQAMKKGDKAAMIGFRNIIGKLKAAQIDKGEILNEEESIKILKSATKQLKESVDQYQKGGREDLAEKELFELSLIDKYLPEQLTTHEIRKVVKDVIQSIGAESMHDMGSVMGMVMNELVGAADGKLVQKVVQKELS